MHLRFPSKGSLINDQNELEIETMSLVITISMKSITKLLSTVGRWTATALFCVSAIAFVWQGAFFSHATAVAAPGISVIASTDAGNQIKRENKGVVRDAAEAVKETANKNANRVEQATDNGSYIERKAQRDAARIEKRANEDSDRTQKAIDNSVGVVERAVEGIKDAFGQ